ncbi:MAG: hypothetical protein QXZ66_06060 [Thermoproteota archaeon]
MSKPSVAFSSNIMDLDLMMSPLNVHPCLSMYAKCASSYSRIGRRCIESREVLNVSVEHV